MIDYKTASLKHSPPGFRMLVMTEGCMDQSKPLCPHIYGDIAIKRVYHKCTEFYNENKKIYTR